MGFGLRNNAYFKSDFSKNELNKIGHSIIYFSNRTAYLSKTKLLKLIYFLDETSVKKFGIPFFNLTYKVWQAGPVNVELFSELSSPDELTLLSDYITIDTRDNTIKSKIDFDDSEFSENEIELLDFVILNYGRFNAAELVILCHRKNTLWYKIAQEKGLLELFEAKKTTTSDYYIDLSEYLDTETKKIAYQEYKDFKEFSSAFK